MSISIDYAVSNREHKNTEILRYCENERNLNQYEQVIKHIGELYQCYDFYKRFTFLGFDENKLVLHNNERKFNTN